MMMRGPRTARRRNDARGRMARTLDGAVAAGGGEARRFRPEGDDGAERTAARAGGGGDGGGGDNTRSGGGPGMPTCATGPEAKRRGRFDGAAATDGAEARRFRPERDGGAGRTATKDEGRGEGIRDNPG